MERFGPGADRGGLLATPVVALLADDAAVGRSDATGGGAGAASGHAAFAAISAVNFTATSLTDTEVIATSLQVYGSLFLCLFGLFLVVRARCPSFYNLKRSYAHLAAPVDDNGPPPLAHAPFGPLSWTWRVFSVPYDDLAEQCGMDAACAIRLCEFGAKVSAVAVLTSLATLPAYKLYGTEITDDTAKEFSLANLPAGSHATITAALAAYVVFGAAMHLIDKVR